MNSISIFHNASVLRERGNEYLNAELKKAGLKELVPSHGDILAVLLHCGPCTMSDLARKVRRTKSTVTTLTDKLERGGYLQRVPNPTDSRSTLVELTEKGQALGPAFQRISVGLQCLVARNLTPEELDTLNALLEKCLHD